MKNRFFTPEPLAAGLTIELAGEELHHARVLRVREGELVEVFDGRGHAFEARLEKGSVIVGGPVATRESPLAITLAMSIINLDKFELVLQKATELGVRNLVPMITDRMEIRRERFQGKTERWLKIILEAVKQSGRSIVPALHEPINFDDAIARDGVNLVFDADQAPTTDSKQPTTLFIGPEGGFSEREIELARARNCSFARLGPRRLRAETAAIVATAMVQSRNGDL